MLRKTLITLTAIAALCVGSTAMAMHGGGGGGGWGGGNHSAGIRGPSIGAMHGSGGGPMMMHGGPMVTAPTVRGPVQGWSGRTLSRNTAWGVHNHFDHFHDHFHHRFHHRNFFAFGFAGPIYDYAYNSCWTRLPTYHGWRWVYVCGDYPY